MHKEMGDHRSTQLLRHLWTLAGQAVPLDFLRTLWTNRLPPNILALTATQLQVPLYDVAQLVGKIAEVNPPPRVAYVSSSGGEISTLTSRIDELAEQVTTLS
jgi:hypothetical protein